MDDMQTWRDLPKCCGSGFLYSYSTFKISYLNCRKAPSHEPRSPRQIAASATTKVPQKCTGKGAALSSKPSEKSLFSDKNSEGGGDNLYPDTDTDEAKSR